MKKLRMIVTSVIVLAIVGSAFAFTTKKVGSFCVSTTAPNTNCQVAHGIFLDPSGPTTLFYQIGWTGATNTCVNSNNCPTQAKFDTN